jgi:hypothetical protein
VAADGREHERRARAVVLLAVDHTWLDHLHPLRAELHPLGESRIDVVTEVGLSVIWCDYGATGRSNSPKAVKKITYRACTLYDNGDTTPQFAVHCGLCRSYSRMATQINVESSRPTALAQADLFPLGKVEPSLLSCQLIGTHPH